MRLPSLLCAGAALTSVILLAGEALADPDQTVRSADQVLHEIMDIPASQIPTSLLSQAQAVAIIPDVIKVGFVAGIRRGHGVVIIRGTDGRWGLPQFVTLTGGSVGWQVGVQGTDVILVFMTRKSVDGLLNGKFTIGADASAAAGPVGRDAAAATDLRLKAEILSYSRSRGLFVGLALDGSAIEVDPYAANTYYGAPAGAAPERIPESAAKLDQDLSAYSGAVAAVEPNLAPPGVPVPVGVPAAPASSRASTRDRLSRNATTMYGALDESWRKYLALPAEVFGEGEAPALDSLQASLDQYNRVATDPKYKALATRADFRATYDTLRAYVREQSAGATPTLALPPPPGDSQ